MRSLEPNRLAAAVVASLSVSLLPAHVLAEDVTAPPAAPAPAPVWSLGGGLTLGSLEYISTKNVGNGVVGFLGPLLRVPGATGTLERRLSDRSWLFVNVSGWIQQERADVPAGSSGYTRDDDRLVTANVGLRRTLTARRAPVEVSTVVGAHGGFDDSERRYTSYGSSTRATETTWFTGASLGIALQRELTDGLALRLSTPLVFATYHEATQRPAGQPRTTATGLTLALTIAPQLELVLFF